MRKHALGSVAVLSATVLLLGTLWAQQPGKTSVKPGKMQTTGKSGPIFRPPDDPRLIKLHEDFVVSVEKLAAEYERANDIDKARQCYERILLLVPTYMGAKEKLDVLHNKEATAEKRVVDVLANKGWQDSGLVLVEGKPVIISANGKWNFKMAYDLTPEGIEIPAELRDFNLGSLIGIIQRIPNPNAPGEAENAPTPFFIGDKKEVTPEYSGKLFLRMYDSDPADNTGKLSVTITGTFGKK